MVTYEYIYHTALGIRAFDRYAKSRKIDGYAHDRSLKCEKPQNNIPRIPISWKQNESNNDRFSFNTRHLDVII